MASWAGRRKDLGFLVVLSEFRLTGGTEIRRSQTERGMESAKKNHSPDCSYRATDQ